MEAESQCELDRPRPIPIHVSRDNTYLSASGNLVCRPVEDQVSNTPTVRSDNRIAAGGGEDQTTHVCCIPPRQLLGNFEAVDGPTSITGIHWLWHNNSFEDLPVLLANQHGTSGYQDTCTLDPGLMIWVYQMKRNPCILPIFTGSSHSIFNKELPSLFNLFMDRKYKDLRGKWAEIIGWSSHSFRGSDGEVMMPPFSNLIEFKYSYECSVGTCPLNDRKFRMPAMILSCHEQKLLDSYKLQQLIIDFTCETINPCWEPIHHTRPDTTGMYQFHSSFYSDSRCSGTRTTHRIVQTSPEQPPMVVLNMTRSRLTRDQIGNLSDTVRIGDVVYYIGGITFAGDEHYTAIIILHQQNQLLFYDNLHGIKVIDTIHQGRASDVLSLLYLFRER